MVAFKLSQWAVTVGTLNNSVVFSVLKYLLKCFKMVAYVSSKSRTCTHLFYKLSNFKFKI